MPNGINGGRWHTSVDALMGVLQEALRALEPSLAKAHVPYRSGESYDAWDHISETVYECLVLEPIRWASGDPDIPIARYGATLANYSDAGVVRVQARNQVEPGAPLLVFHSLDPDASFTRVRCVRCDLGGGVLDRGLATIEMPNAVFDFRYRDRAGNMMTLSDLFVLE